jgi:hypothetical protein
MVLGLKDLVQQARRNASQISPFEGDLNAWVEAGLPTEEGS